MNNYCRNCGNKLDKDAKFCSKCTAEVFKGRIDVEKKRKQLEEYKKKENRYIIIVISLFAISYVLHYFSFFANNKFFSILHPLLWLMAIVSLIYVRINMNDSKKIRIMFNIFVGIIILYLVILLIMFITCMNTINKGCS